MLNKLLLTGGLIIGLLSIIVSVTLLMISCNHSIGDLIEAEREDFGPY